MDFPLKILDTQEFRELWDKSDAGAFVHSFAGIVQKLFFGQVMCYDTSVFSPDGMRMTLACNVEGDTARILVRHNFVRSRRDARYAADDELLAKVEKILSFRDRCEAHLRYYASRGWKTWWSDMRKCLIIRRCKRRASLVLSEQDLWSLAVALYVRKGLGTAENFARRIQTEE